jgi:ABC-type Fe3+ transport system substrate-binding protein
MLASSLLFACNQDNSGNSINAEEDEIASLYRDAQTQGERQLVVWAGGDAPTSPNNWIVAEWKKDFPDIDLQLITDLSKFHDVTIDKELALGNPTADVTHLQTVQNFQRWRDEGHLEAFKPASWNKIPDDIKDQDGYYLPVYMITFAHYVNKNNIISEPDSFTDYLKPEYKDNLILTYPHDDDAVLYLYKKIVDKYGWEFVDNLLAQNPRWIRGTAAPRAVVARGEKMATFGVAASFTESTTGKTVLPTEDTFLTWAQTGGIFKKARHKTAAKLYISWLTSKKMQEKWIQWSVRNDIQTKAGYRPYSTYPNTSPVDFFKFMVDRESLEIFKKQIEEKIGPVQGDSPLIDPEILSLL